MTPRELYILGTGRMARSLAHRLRPAFERVEVHPSRELTPESFLSRESPRATFILAVTDRAIKPLTLAILPSLRDGDVLLHLAGMLGPEELSAAKNPPSGKVSVGALHPLAAVSSKRKLRPLRPLGFLFEGEPEARDEVQRFCRAVHATVLCASEVERAGYHAAAALVATGAVALAQGAHQLLVKYISPVPTETQLRVALASLLCSVAQNVLADGASGALASPLLRGDTDSVARHLAAMDSVPLAREMYRAALSEVLVTLEAQGGVSPETLRGAKALLSPGGV